MKSTLVFSALAAAATGAHNLVSRADSNTNMPELIDIGELAPAATGRPTAMIEDVGLPQAKASVIAARVQKARAAAAAAAPPPHPSQMPAAATMGSSRDKVTAIQDGENNRNSSETVRSRMPSTPAARKPAPPPRQIENSPAAKSTAKKSDMATNDDESAAVSNRSLMVPATVSAAVLLPMLWSFFF
ncbi:hypothetical protein IW140_004203 [Coemansia sp. RSA 1813]|nr:hypothetical protein EV178_004305 [Coemansia sp. RSA 1646]KAJ1767064.1 hypothetical protein LPJ74_005569 [Coemansia sp. RSA 1843]KAJ2088056.1 hypothetical protein IW138_004476 [Coemansia sp. RSA 986]KAJ2210770.1 hypothetical protein EV179_006002 [Coemansia sp. RSA 487]KAJ2568032.1 hypothetical protein IW140_004203 [Coemansia sp. RSA 1813]